MFGTPGAIDTTIVVPTFNEGGNVVELVDRLCESFRGRSVEVLFVDDSTDGTPGVIESTASTSHLPVRMIHRSGDERLGGLAGAVTAGIESSRGDYVVVMDGDLQHPPEMAPVLREAAEGVDLAVASRYTGSGEADGLSSGYRRAVSSGSTVLARACFPRRVGAVTTDPMTGFFCVRRNAVDLSLLRPRGFKILLEILARHTLDVVEIPFSFGERKVGESKASWRNGLHFMFQMAALRMGRMSRFAAVGAAGTLVNLGVMALLVNAWVGLHYVAAAAVAALVSILHNFVLQERFVFQDLREGRNSRNRRLAQHLSFNGVEALVRLPFLMMIVQVLGVASVLAQGLTLVVAFVLRFVFTSRVVYRGRSPEVRETPSGLAPVTSPYSWLTPPSDSERDSYLASPQHRWLFWFQTVAFAGVAVSLYGVAQNNYWTLAFLAPLLVFLLEQVLTLRTSTYRRRVTLPDHRFLVETWAPSSIPSVDVFLPVAGEDIQLVENTARHVSLLEWTGQLKVYLLDDAGDPVMRDLAARYGFEYLARPGNAFKKAGNLQWAYERSGGEHITILDADFVPRPDYLLELVPYLDTPSVGIVQSPQFFFTNKAMTWLERCAGATQELFYRFIQPSRDAVGAAICVGTSAVYRREALEAIGGFPLIGHSEDVYTGIEMGRAGYELQYVPVLVSRGRCPDDLDSFISQQYRWCEGSMTLMAGVEFHVEESMTLAQRLSYWSGFLYYLTTAMNALLAPLGVLVMVGFFPERVTSIHALPLLGSVALWMFVLPTVSHARWRLDVLRVQAVYSFAHLFCIVELLRGKVSEWVPTNAGASGIPIAKRVKRFMAGYVGATQLLVVVLLVVQAWQFGVERYWANIALALISLYVFLPVVWLCLRRRAEPLGAELPPQPRAESRVIDLVRLERAAESPAAEATGGVER